MPLSLDYLRSDDDKLGSYRTSLTCGLAKPDLDKS